jgi:hypothetical protein
VSILDVLQMGEPSRLDALWREHERLALRVEVLTELLVSSTGISRDDIDAAARRAAERLGQKVDRQVRGESGL